MPAPTNKQDLPQMELAHRRSDPIQGAGPFVASPIERHGSWKSQDLQESMESLNISFIDKLVEEDVRSKGPQEEVGATSFQSTSASLSQEIPHFDNLLAYLKTQKGSRHL